MSIKGLIKETFESAIADSGLNCDFFLPDDLFPAGVDSSRFASVVSDIMKQAIEVTPGGGTVLVSADNVVLKGMEGPPIDPGPYVKVSISDIGEGISTDGIESDWHISVESEGGAVATISIYLPAEEACGRQEAERSGSLPECRGKVLIMDDEETIRELAVDFLSPYGHTVEYAKDGEEALELYRKAVEEGEPFDVVIMDLNIQTGMDGKETIRRLLKMDPGVRAIASSGYPDDPVMCDFSSYGFKEAIAKPCSMAELHRVLHSVINRGD